MEMTDKQFWQSKWKPFEVMTVYLKEFGRDCECLLVGIDFEDKVMKLRPLDAELYEDDIFEAPIKIITRGKSKPKMKIVK